MTRRDGGRDVAEARPQGPWSVVAVESKSPHDVAVDETHVYWINHFDGALRRIAKSGGSAETLANAGAIRGHTLALSPTEVFFTTSYDSIMRLSKAGGTARVLVSEQSEPNSLTYSSDALFWAAGPGTSRSVLFVRTDVEASMPVLLTDGHYAIGKLAADAQHVFFTRFGNAGPTDGAVLRVPRAGGVADVLVSDIDTPYAMGVDDTHVFWTEGAKVRPVNNIWNGRIQKLPKNAAPGTVPTTLAAEHAGGFDLVVDDDTVYWSSQFPDGILAVGKDGGLVRQLAWDQNQPTAIAADKSFIYWTNFTFEIGAIMKVPKSASR